MSLEHKNIYGNNQRKGVCPDCFGKQYNCEGYPGFPICPFHDLCGDYTDWNVSVGL